MKVLKTLSILLIFAALWPMTKGSASEDRILSFHPGYRAEFANVSFSSPLTSTEEVEITLALGMPYGCFKPDVGVEHRDEFTHVLKPVLLHDGYRCSRPTSLDFQKMSLGYLPSGEHKIIVENLDQAFEPLTFWVAPNP